VILILLSSIWSFWQMLYHLGMAWDLRWRTCQDDSRKFSLQKRNVSLESVIPSIEQVFFCIWAFHGKRIFIFSLHKVYYKIRHWLVSGRILWLPLIHITNPGNYFVIVAVVFRHGLHNPSDYLLSLILMRCTIYIIKQLSWMDMDWCSILQRTQRHMNLLEPFIPFRRVLLQTLSCRDSILQNLLQSATTLRKV
jgi:hypothetical protein